MPEKNGDKPHRFINEKIVRQPLSKRQIARRILLTAFCGVLFGVLAAVCFVVSKPLAERYLGQEQPEESSQITIPKDELETTTAAPVETTQAVSQPPKVDDLNTMYGSLRSVATEVGKGVVAVHSIQHQVDWFDNPIETTGQYAGVLIAKTKTEALILTRPDQEGDPGGIGQFLLREAGRHGDRRGRTCGDRSFHGLRFRVLCGEKRPGGGRHLKGVLLGCTVQFRDGDLYSQYQRPADRLGDGQI